MSKIWRKKPISLFEAEMKKSNLNRVLGRWGLTSLGIGAIIGGGIFTLTGVAAHNNAGPALALAFVIVCNILKKVFIYKSGLLYL